MHFVYLSPHFPPNYYPFCVELRRAGVNVLGVADAPYEALRPELREALGEYYRVDDLHDYDQLVRTLGHFTHRHGKLDRVDSHSEYWLETEARLRTDFNLFGLRADAIAGVKRKSRMKAIYREAGVPTARGAVVDTLEEGRALVAEVGYPVVAKPDVGVGAAGTWKIHTPDELAEFFARKPPVAYLLEEFVQGQLVSFDGLADRDGEIVFCAAHAFSQGIMETVNEDRDLFYYSLREIPPDLEEAGRRTVKAFGVRERFFHLEFFRADGDGRIVALEVNLRPPGGLTTDMFNYANDIDIYRQWAQVVAFNRFTAHYSRPYHCGYMGRKASKRYARSHAEVLRALGDGLVHHTPIDSIFRGAIGDYGYLVRSADLDEVRHAARLIQQLA
ncbi:MAG: ATP-grasp domain-containing protein [Deferrisomatales bacterium]|nr:ATP-grasp domain-containing protein [Deferrisomatales bacterium]